MKFSYRTRADYTDDEWAAYIAARRAQADAAKAWRDAVNQTGQMIVSALDEHTKERPTNNRAERRAEERARRRNRGGW